MSERQQFGFPGMNKQNTESGSNMGKGARSCHNGSNETIYTAGNSSTDFAHDLVITEKEIPPGWNRKMLYTLLEDLGRGFNVNTSLLRLNSFFDRNKR
jgi:hypothetical protein